ncbi:MAG: phosphoribosylaminoimidazolesuccinocarboxamide synthase [archaeon]
MGKLENLALAITNDFQIKHEGDVHNGKVRSVYWLTPEDSKRLTEQRGYKVHPETQLAVMIISDRISAFDVNWKAEEGLHGIPQKGAALNQTSKYWFDEFDRVGLAGNHIVDVPHPLVWIVQKAQPIMVEAISRQYITGSMWRHYDEDDQREFGGVKLPNGLQKNQRLDELLITPSTKGIMRGISGIPEKDDVDITRRQILDNWEAFGFRSPEDVALYEQRLRQGCALADPKLNGVGQIFVDTKFEFGYIRTPQGNWEMIYIDEVLTPDSSRFWDRERYKQGDVVENSKEGFRDFLRFKSGFLSKLFTDKANYDALKIVAEFYRVPVDQFMEVSDTYRGIAKTITGKEVPNIENPRQEILDTLAGYELVA